MKAWFWEQIAFTCALLVVAGSMIIFGSGAGLEKAEARPILPYTPGQMREGAADETAGPVWTGTPWLPPSALSQEEAWIYELFGPPEIHYDAALQQLKVASLNNEPGRADGTMTDVPELMAIHRVPFRLQLVGHFGEGSEATGTFANMKTGETFLALAGREVPELDLTIAKFNVARQPVAIPDSMTTVESVAAAEVLDKATGERTVLTDREWVYVEPAAIQSAEKYDPAPPP